MSNEKTARIVVVGGEKGGTGKTTIATNLAACLALRGRDVLLLDTDLQGSASDWTSVRDLYRDGQQKRKEVDPAYAEPILPRVGSVQKVGSGLLHELKDMARRYDEIIVDAGGRDSPELRSAIVAASILVSPIQASTFDVWTVPRLDELYRQAAAINESLKVLIVLNRASTNAASQDSQRALELLGEFPHFTVAKTELHNRVAYPRAAQQGKGVAESKDDEKAATEIESLFAEVYG
jgi:chromosome partitioning protein